MQGTLEELINAIVLDWSAMKNASKCLSAITGDVAKSNNQWTQVSLILIYLRSIDIL